MAQIEFVVFAEFDNGVGDVKMFTEVYAKDKREAALSIANGNTGEIGLTAQGSGTYWVARESELSRFDVIESKTHVIKETVNVG